MYTVPSICEPIHGQPVAHYEELYPHLIGLDLADDAEEASPCEIEVLVGSDFYWDLITRVRFDEDLLDQLQSIQGLDGYSLDPHVYLLRLKGSLMD